MWTVYLGGCVLSALVFIPVSIQDYREGYDHFRDAVGQVVLMSLLWPVMVLSVLVGGSYYLVHSTFRYVVRRVSRKK